MNVRISCLAAALALSVAGVSHASNGREPGSTWSPATTTTKVTNPLEIRAAGFPAGTDEVYVTDQLDYFRMASSSPNGPMSASAVFGNTAVSRMAVSGLEFELLTTSVAPGDRTDWGRVRCSTAGFTTYGAQVQLPAGAQILGFDVWGQDTNADVNLSAEIFPVVYSGTFGGATGPSYGATISSLSPMVGFNGGYFHLESGVLDHTVDPVNPYHVILSFPTCASSTVSFLRADVRFRRQISPAPVTATFADVGVGAPFHREIEALVASGITLGCGGGNYCPNENVTRGQMAAFLARALGLHWAE